MWRCQLPSTILQHTLLLLELQVLLLVDVREAPLLGDDNLLATRELVASAAESLHDNVGVVVPGSDGENDLANVDTGHSAVGLTPCTTHTGLESIGSSTGQHLVDTEDVEWVDTDTEMERVLSRGLGHVLVGTNTGGFESLGGELLVFIGNEVRAEGEFVDVGTLTAEIEDPDLGIRNTTVVPRLGVRLVFAVAVAASRTTTHC